MAFLVCGFAPRARAAPRPEPELDLDRDDERPPPGVPAIDYPRRAFAITVAWASAPLGWDARDWKAFGMAAAVPLTLIVSGADDTVQHAITGNRSPAKDRIANAGDQIGAVPVAAGIFAAFGAYGYAFDSSRALHVMESGVLSTTLSGALTTALKIATGRARPNAGVGSRDFHPFGGQMSFPSGHTTVAFSVAGVIAAHYPGAPATAAYAAALTCAYARVYNFHHWPSDVLAAALMSTATARFVSRLNLDAAHGDLILRPAPVGESAGIELGRRF